MNKLDEIIRYDFDAMGHLNQPKFKNAEKGQWVLFEDLEQLRPYVELGEFYYNKNKGLLGLEDDPGEPCLSEIEIKLIQQIKELESCSINNDKS